MVWYNEPGWTLSCFYLYFKGFNSAWGEVCGMVHERREAASKGRLSETWKAPEDVVQD